MLALWKFFTSPIGLCLIGAVAGLVLIAVVYSKGEHAGSSGVTSAVEHATNAATEKARKDKEAADEKARNAPIGDVIDRTR